ncbi:hypothetical protein GTX14_04400 [Streptomyces sp. SID4944]|nr:hypothetical protein [Streptomyces sp. SID4944]
MPGEDAIREQVRRLLAAADGFGLDGLEPHDYQKHASVVLDMIRPLVFALGQYQALELGTPEGRISAKCDDSSHPVWLRDLDDMRGCPWCRVAELEAQAEKTAAFCAQRAEYVTSILNCHPDNAHDYYRWQGHAEARRQLSQSLGLPVGWPAEDKQATTPTPAEDPHDGPLHHSYALGRDLPEVTPDEQARRDESVAKLRALLARQSGGAS